MLNRILVLISIQVLTPILNTPLVIQGSLKVAIQFKKPKIREIHYGQIQKLAIHITVGIFYFGHLRLRTVFLCE